MLRVKLPLANSQLPITAQGLVIKIVLFYGHGKILPKNNQIKSNSTYKLRNAYTHLRWIYTVSVFCPLLPVFFTFSLLLEKALQFFICIFMCTYIRTNRRVARIWKRGGLFWKSEKCANDFDSNFSLNLKQFLTVCLKIETKFLGKLGNSKDFFRLKTGGLKKKKKKRSSPKLRLIFRPISQIQTFEGGLFSYGGAIFNFSQKIGLKSIKNMRFCILHEPMGGLEPPRAPPWLRYCAQTKQSHTGQKFSKKNFLQRGIFERKFYLYVTVCLVQIWTYKNADEKAHTFSRRSKKHKKTGENRRKTDTV